jgi:hypothetical protein
MSNPGHSLALDEGAHRPQPARQRFAARIGRFDDHADRALMDELAAWVEAAYREELEARPSKHVYLRKPPGDVAARIDRRRDSPIIRSAILEQVDAGAVITPVKDTDELYISHYNQDFGGDHGLFTRHYDGNLRFMPIGAVVRGLICLQSDATYKVVFGDSQVEKAF